MGREHRLQTNAQLREAGDRRAPRIPVALSADIGRFAIRRRDAIVGIDVGEDFLDLAILAPRASRLEYSRIDLRKLSADDPIESLATALRAHVPACDAIAIVDAPRVPLAADSSQRKIDSTLRRLVADRGNKLSMFPTPRRAEFEAFIADPRCKPHLVAIARRIFGKTRRMPTVDTLPRGRLFTRFMLAGFATHLSLDAIGTRTYEGYPYLAFSLWKPPRLALPPKSDRTALAVRIAILRDLVRTLDIRLDAPASLDEADAASLVLTAALCARSNGTALAISDPREGQFLLPMPAARGA